MWNKTYGIVFIKKALLFIIKYKYCKYYIFYIYRETIIKRIEL